MKESLIKLRQFLLSGVSYAIPFIACGGIMIAMSIAFVPIRPGPKSKGGGPDFSHSPILKEVNEIGSAAFTLMPVMLAGYIAYGMAGKPGLVPGCVGGWLVTNLPDPVNADKTLTAGFLGAIVAGLVGGWIVMWLKKLPVPKHLRPIMPILIIPIISSAVVGVLVLNVLGYPIAQVNVDMAAWLARMQTGNAVILATILGCMIAFDMGGPVNKAAFFFGSGLIASGNFTVMGSVAAAICTPPLGMGLATLMQRKLWTQDEREAGIAGLAMGMIGITEGAIPFAAADPLRVIPCICFGSAVAAVVAMLGKVGDHAPHGGPIVLPVVDNRIMYVTAIVIGTVVTAVSINLVKIVTHSAPKAEMEEK